MGRRNLKSFGSRFGRCAALAALAASVACGEGNTVAPLPPPTPVPPPPPPRVVSEGGGSLEVDFVGRTVFSNPLPGRLDATVDWTFATNDLDVYVARGDCDFDPFFEGQCEIVGLSESTTAKPERVSVAVATTGIYTMFVGNFGPEDESLSWQVVLTPSGATGGAAASVHGERAGWTTRLKPGAVHGRR